jgi:hypothetical protein
MKKNNDDRKIPFLYIKIWVDALRAREKGDENTEDLLLEKLDEIWFSMTATQISFINSLSEKLVNNKITLQQIENKYSKKMITRVILFNSDRYSKINGKKGGNLIKKGENL